MDIADLRQSLDALGREEVIHAALFRLRAPLPEPVPTGVTVRLGYSADRTFLELRGIEGELPANVRIEGTRLLGSSVDTPDDWQELGGSDVQELLVYSLLDPRLLADQLQHVTVDEVDKGVTVASARIELDRGRFQLPPDFIRWLPRDSRVRRIRLVFVNDRLAEITQPDLPPWQEDIIIERFSGAPVLAPRFITPRRG